jgi:hypothetical protein
MQERCGLLEEENRRLRDGYDNGGAAPEEDDLVRITTTSCLSSSSLTNTLRHDALQK